MHEFQLIVVEQVLVLLIDREVVGGVARTAVDRVAGHLDLIGRFASEVPWDQTFFELNVRFSLLILILVASEALRPEVFGEVNLAAVDDWLLSGVGQPVMFLLINRFGVRSDWDWSLFAHIEESFFSRKHRHWDGFEVLGV